MHRACVLLDEINDARLYRDEFEGQAGLRGSLRIPSRTTLGKFAPRAPRRQERQGREREIERRREERLALQIIFRSVSESFRLSLFLLGALGENFPTVMQNNRFTLSS